MNGMTVALKVIEKSEIVYYSDQAGLNKYITLDIRKDVQKGYHRIDVEKQMFTKKMAVISSRLANSKSIDNQIRGCETVLEFLSEQEISLEIKTTQEKLSEPRRILQEIEEIENSPG